MAGLYNGHVLEFPQIRVDSFTTPPRPPHPPWLLPHPTDPWSPPFPAPPAQLFLLTHVHTDHLIGLDNQFTGKIICSHDTKAMLLRLEAEVDRAHYGTGVRERRKRKYEGLKAKVVDRGTRDERVIDHIEAIPFGVPKVYEIGYEDGRPINVTITLFDANHCPGSTMFLITSPDRAVLHTGDVRADELFLRSLRRNPVIGQFMAPQSVMHRGSAKSDQTLTCGRRILDRMYIDTGAIVGTGDMPDREGVLQDLVEEMSLYPQDTVFFLNVWCFGWEDVVKEVARYFDCLVHVDRYKREIYKAVKSDPFLVACTTLDPTATRFHACDRRAKCEECRVFNSAGERVWNVNKRIVSVNMVEVKSASWELERKDFLQKLSSAATGQGSWPYTIDCPIARHSPLPEIQRLVKLFKPHALSPNTVAREVQGMDYYLLPRYFQDHLASDEDIVRLKEERDRWFKSHPAYGPVYLQILDTLALEPAEDSVPGIALPLKLDPEVKYELERVGATQRGRRAHAADQISRAVGLPSISGDDLGIVMAALNDGQHGIAPSSAAISGMGSIMSLVGGGSSAKHEAAGRARPLHNEEYDRDEEEEHEVKRRRRRTLNDQDDHTTSLSGSRDADRLQKQRERNAISTEDVKPDIRRASHSASVMKIRSHCRPPVSRKSFLVDKEHLRALAMVAADVDDL